MGSFCKVADFTLYLLMCKFVTLNTLYINMYTDKNGLLI